MEYLTRKINYKTRKCPIYTSEEAEKKGFDVKYWKLADKGDWAVSDDGYVGECISKKSYTDKNGKTKYFIKLVHGCGWENRYSQISYLENKKFNLYSKPKPSTWAEKEVRTARFKHVATSYVSMLTGNGKIDYETLGNIYRPDQKNPAATVKRLLKNKVVSTMIEEKLKEILVGKGITKQYAVDNLVDAIDMSKHKGDISNFLKANDQIMDLLEMKPSKRVVTDTLQIDLTKQIAEQISGEEQRLLPDDKKIEQR